jgi:hypothetical protein
MPSALSRQLNRRVDMSENRPIENPKGSTLGSEKVIGNGAAPQLTEELERVVGGYIGGGSIDMARRFRQVVNRWVLIFRQSRRSAREATRKSIA